MALPELFANPTTPGTSVALTTLGTGLTINATTLITNAVAPAALQGSGQFRILIDNEYMIVTGGASSTSWTITRGAEGSTPATHNTSALIWHILTAGAMGNQSDALPGVPSIRSLGTGANQAASGNDSRITGALQVANNLSELISSAATARGNLGLSPAVLRKGVVTATPSGTANTNGTTQTVSPSIDHFLFTVQAVRLVSGGTFGSETLTVNVIFTFSDTTSQTFSTTFTATNVTTDLTNGNLLVSAFKDGVSLATVGIDCQSTIANSQANVTATIAAVNG